MSASVACILVVMSSVVMLKVVELPNCIQWDMYMERKQSFASGKNSAGRT